MDNSVFAQVLNENKERFIKKLNCDQDTKDYFLSFFKSHSNLENKIDWNKDSDSLIADIFNLIDETRLNKEHTDNAHELYRHEQFIPDIDWESNDCEVIDEDENYIYIYPLNYTGSKFCDSVPCGGAGAKWCIGDSDGDGHFYRYNCTLDEIFIMQFNKHPTVLKQDLKIMWEINNRSASAWNQIDKKTGSVNDLGKIFPTKVPSDTTAIPSSAQLKMMTHFADWFKTNYRQSDNWERAEEIHDSILEDNYDTDSYEEFSVALQDAVSAVVDYNPAYDNIELNPYVEWESPEELYGAGEWVVKGLYDTSLSDSENADLIQEISRELAKRFDMKLVSLEAAYHEYADKFDDEYAIRKRQNLEI